MPHLTDDDLVRHFYGDARRQGESAVEEHLRGCAECRAAWQELRTALRMVDASTVPEPDPAFEQRLWARVESALRAPLRTDAGLDAVEARLRRRPALVGLAIAASLAVAVSATVLSVRAWRPPVGTTAPAMASDPNGRERVLLTGLDDHFQRSEILLVEVMNAPASGGEELGFERQTADDLVDWGRLYRVAAQQNGNFQLAQMLEDLESVMVEIARSPDRMGGDDFRSLRSRIEDDNLLFKVRAVSQQIQDRRKDLSTD